MKRFRPELAWCCLLWLPLMASANQDNESGEARPSLEMLAFLGEWQDDDGDFVPPDELTGVDGSQKAPEATEKPETTNSEEMTHVRGDER